MGGDAVVGGIALTGGDGVARLLRLLGRSRLFGDDGVTGLPGHGEPSLNLHPSIGSSNRMCSE
jgi:hypothetical protein